MAEDFGALQQLFVIDHINVHVQWKHVKHATPISLSPVFPPRVAAGSNS